MADSLSSTSEAGEPLPPPPGGGAGKTVTMARGLTDAEAFARAAAGLSNSTATKERTNADVARDNALNFFNLLMIGMVVALFMVGAFQDAMFVGIVVFLNIAVSTYQEILAVSSLRQLVALTAPHATVVRSGVERQIEATEVVQGDLVHLSTGDQVVADGTVAEREAEIDESLLTGESDSVKKRPGDEVLSGAFCVAGDLFYTAERVGLEAYAMKLTADAKTHVKWLTPLELQVKRLMRVLLTATAVLAFALMVSYNVGDESSFSESVRDTTALVTTVVPAGMLLGITVTFAMGALRVSRAGAIVQEIRTVESLNYVDVICLDKTGTITANKLTVDDTRWMPGAEVYQPWLGAFAAATADESKTALALSDAFGKVSNGAKPGANVAFSSARRWSAMTLELGGEQRTFVLGAPETIERGASEPIGELKALYEEASEKGLRGVIFAEAPGMPPEDEPLAGLRPVALIVIADVLRPEVQEAFKLMGDLEIEPKIISGDNPGTVSALMGQLGLASKGHISGTELERMSDDGFDAAVDAHTVFGRISPDQKARIVGALQRKGHYVAMVGDGANDVHALRKADTAVAMESGTSTARAVAGIVLRNDSFAALIRGTQEATFVLGNSARLNKLFVAKSIYVFLLIFATNLLGLSFPFLPRHGSLTSLLALGIPAVFITISIPPKRAGEDFLNNIMKFALPAAAALALSAMLLQFFVEGVLDRNEEDTRTLVSLVLGLGGIMYVVEVLGFEGASFRSLTRPVMTIVLGIVLVLVLMVTVYVPWLRSFFGFTPVDPLDWAAVYVAVGAALGVQFYLTRYWQDLANFLLATPSDEDQMRGRSV